jgi:hypothetical protein
MRGEGGSSRSQAVAVVLLLLRAVQEASPGQYWAALAVRRCRRLPVPAAPACQPVASSSSPAVRQPPCLVLLLLLLPAWERRPRGQTSLLQPLNSGGATLSRACLQPGGATLTSACSLCPRARPSHAAAAGALVGPVAGLEVAAAGGGGQPWEPAAAGEAEVERLQRQRRRAQCLPPTSSLPRPVPATPRSKPFPAVASCQSWTAALLQLQRPLAFPRPPLPRRPLRSSRLHLPTPPQQQPSRSSSRCCCRGRPPLAMALRLPSLTRMSSSFLCAHQRSGTRALQAASLPSLSLGRSSHGQQGQQQQGQG